MSPGRAVGHGRSARSDGDILSLVDGGISAVGESGSQAGEEGNGSNGETHFVGLLICLRKEAVKVIREAWELGERM